MTAADPIKHVVLLMMENHSFDQMLGCLQGVYPELEGVDVDSTSPRFNLDLHGNRVFQTPTDEQQMRLDPKHDKDFVLDQLANNNSGFVTDFESNVPGNAAEDRQNIMGYYLLDRLPALHQLGRNFTVCDHWFSSVPGPTWCNRFFALSGTSSGRVLMPEGIEHPNAKELFAQNQDTLFDRLNEAKKPWKVYFYDFPSSLLLNHQRRIQNLKNYHRIDQFYRDVLDEGSFPSFVFIEPKYFGADQNDDHPPHNIFKAEKLIADVYNAIRSSPEVWHSTLLVVVYDEHGGFYDHVEPPAAVPPDDHREEWTFDRLGVRVPAILVSPWVGARVEKTRFDHTSLLKYLSEKWDLGPLGRRTETANSIRVAINQSRPVENTVPFIRVPYTNLIPEKPDLEQKDASDHQMALQSFAWYLASVEGWAASELVDVLARDANLWTRMKAGLGETLLRIGSILTKDLERLNKQKVRATTDIAMKGLSANQ